MSHRRRSRITFLALVLPLIGLAACGDSVTGEDDDDIRGVWSVQAGQFVTYLEITDSSISVYLGSPTTCFERVSFDIVSTDGDTYTLGQDGVSGTQALIIRRAGAQLEVRDPDEPNVVAAVYNPASQDLSVLDLCTGGGADPAIVCEDLPQVGPDEPTVGSLSTDDPTSVYGSHFDLYGLQLESSGEVRIDLTSTDFDSYLLVYLGDGTLIADNDDLDNATRDASVTLDLDPGCYRIEATSFSASETGGYTLSVE